MQNYLISREQLDELKEKAVKLRTEPPPNASELAGTSYEIEQLVADVETSPTTDEGSYLTEMTEDDNDEE